MMHAGCLAVTLWAAAGAVAAAEPLLVVVEGNRAGGPSAEAIRRAIAEELKRPVVGPRDATAGARDLLLVTVGATSVSMQLMRLGHGAPPRHVKAVPAGSSGVQVVAWLAGNLVRDQAADLLPALQSREQPAAQEPAAAPAEPGTGPENAPPPRPPTEPPAHEAPPLAPSVAAVARAHQLPPPAGPPLVPWRFGVQAGLGAWLHDSPVLGNGGPFFPTARIELLGRPFLGRWGAWGTLNLEGGRIAAGASAGIVRRIELKKDWWAAEFGVGAGFLVADVAHTVFTPGGVQTESRLAINALVHGIATLAFTHSSMGEVVMSVGVNDGLAQLWWPDLLVTWGVRIAL